MAELSGTQVLLKKNLSFAEALQYAESRKIVLPDVYYGKLMGIQRSQAVSVAGMTSVEQIKFIVDQLDATLKNGGTFKDFQKAVNNNTLNIDLPVHRLDNIFRTNIQAAYSRGRWEQQTKVSGTRPFLMYDAINDGRTRPAHSAMDGTILPRTSSWWDTHYPPNGYRCRCTVISLTSAQARARGYVDGNPPPEDAPPDDGWDYNPGADYQKRTPDLINKTIQKAVQNKPKMIAPAQAAKKAIERKAEKVTLDSVRELGRKTIAELDQGDYNTPAFHKRLEDLVVRRVTGVEDVRLEASAPIRRGLVNAHVKEHLGDDVFQIRKQSPDYSKDGFNQRMMDRLALPKSWLKSVKDYYRYVPVEYNPNRAFAKQGLYDTLISVDPDRGHTVLHEFMHLVQVAKPEVQALAVEYHELRNAGRTTRKRLADLVPNARYDITEVAREDHYFNPYVGKEYAHSYTGNVRWKPLEVLTVAIEALLGDVVAYSNAGFNTRRVMFHKDRELAEFALGLILSYA